MQRYYFDVHDGSNHYIDELGQELPDAGTARMEALAATPQIAAEEMPDGDRREFIVNVRDASRRLIFTATMSLVARWIA